MSRPRPIEGAFRRAARAGRKVLIPYVMAGDTSLKDVIGAVRDIRLRTDVPVVLMSYYNPVLQYGLAAFAADAAAAGVDGLIVPDLPPEEGADLIGVCRKAGLATIFLLAPTSDPGRMARIAKVSTGFIYYVSLTGTTGAPLTDHEDVARRIADIRKLTGKPIAVGFGITTPDQAARVGRIADGVIVGSALVQVMEHAVESGADKVVAAARDFVAGLRRGLDA